MRLLPGLGEAHSLGFGEPIAISAEHAEGLDGLYDALVAAGRRSRQHDTGR